MDPNKKLTRALEKQKKTARKRWNRPGRAGKTLDMPIELHNAILDLARSPKERRNFTQMALMLLEEALEARGIVISQPSQRSEPLAPETSTAVRQDAPGTVKNA